MKRILSRTLVPWTPLFPPFYHAIASSEGGSLGDGGGTLYSFTSGIILNKYIDAITEFGIPIYII
jgi:hypothetical protein